MDNRDGMTPQRAEELVAEVGVCKRKGEAALLAGDFDTIVEMKNRIDAINKEARRLNTIRQQKITGWMGKRPTPEAQEVLRG